MDGMAGSRFKVGLGCPPGNPRAPHPSSGSGMGQDLRQRGAPSGTYFGSKRHRLVSGVHAGRNHCGADHHPPSGVPMGRLPCDPPAQEDVLALRRGVIRPITWAMPRGVDAQGPNFQWIAFDSAGFHPGDAQTPVFVSCAHRLGLSLQGAGWDGMHSVPLRQWPG
jgi:hypothetical protein